MNCLIYNIINMAPNSASPKMITTMTTASKSYTFIKCKQQSKSGVVKAKKPSGFTLFYYILLWTIYLISVIINIY